MRYAVLAGMALLAGCTASAEQRSSQQADAARDLAKAIGDRTAGKPERCITSTMTDGPQIIDARTIVYRQGGKIWVNNLPDECPGLSPYKTMITELYGTQICDSDKFRTVDPGVRIPGPYCRFGKFTPYSKR